MKDTRKCKTCGHTKGRAHFTSGSDCGECRRMIARIRAKDRTMSIGTARVEVQSRRLAGEKTGDMDPLDHTDQIHRERLQRSIDQGNAAAAEFLFQQRSKHPIPSGKSMVTVEKGIHYTRQGRYRPKANGKWLGSFYTLDGAREALEDYAKDRDIKKLKLEIRKTKQKLETLQEALEALENEK